MEKQPGFIRELSKDDPESRTQLAHAIREVRNLNRETYPVSAELEQKQQELKQLQERMELLSEKGFLHYIKHFLEMRALSTQIAAEHIHVAEIEAKLVGLQAQQEELQERFSSQGIELDTPQQMLHNFYAHQKELWASQDYSPEDIEAHMNEKTLAVLSLEDYATLWRRFPRQYVTHVTRQGVRDHLGHDYHTAGLDQMHTGMTDMLEDMRIDSPLTVALTGQEKKAWIAAALHLQDKTSRESAIKALDHYLNPELQGIGSYADRATIHFAAQEVADGYYGGERGNETFLIYPSAFIATHFYQGQINRPESEQGNDRNDIWVWTQENQGIDINAGIVFLPAEANVDPNSGSQYKTKEGKALIEEGHQHTLQELFSRHDFLDFAQQNKDRYKDRALAKELEATFSLDLPLAQALAHRLYRVKDILVYQNTRSDRLQQEIKTIAEEVLRKEGMYYQKADTTIKSEEYWENYFAHHPEQRPNKIVYYRGSDPTGALRAWLDEQKIIKQSGVDLEEQNVRYAHISEHMQETFLAEGQAIDRFRSLALSVIDEYFPS